MSMFCWVEVGTNSSEDDITVLRHVRSTAERREAEEIANRTPCKDFKDFKPLFEQAAYSSDVDQSVQQRDQRVQLY